MKKAVNRKQAAFENKSYFGRSSATVPQQSCAIGDRL